jgi:hypothetical protein
VEISDAGRNAQQAQPDATPRETQGRRQTEEQGGAANTNGEARTRPQQGGRPAQETRQVAETGGDDGGALRTRRTEQAAQEDQADATRARRQQNPGRNIGTRIDVAG